MLRSKLFKPFSYTLVFVALLDFIVLKFHLFSSIMWFDMVMHFAGGFLISLLALWLYTQGSSQQFSYGQLLLCGLASALIVGIIWECFELYYGITYWYSPDYWGDNGMDVVMDTLGGLIAVWFSYFKLKILN